MKKKILLVVLFFSVLTEVTRANKWTNHNTFIQQKWEFTKANFSLDDTTNAIEWKRLKGYTDKDSLKWTTVYWLRSEITTQADENGNVIGIMVHFPLPYQLFIDRKPIAGTLTSGGSVNSSLKMPVLWAPSTAGKHEILFMVIGPYPWQWKNLNTDILITVGDSKEMLETSRVQSIILSSTLLWMSGFFLAMGVVHLILFLFYRRETSNLYYGLNLFVPSV